MTLRVRRHFFASSVMELQPVTNRTANTVEIVDVDSIPEVVIAASPAAAPSGNLVITFKELENLPVGAFQAFRLTIGLYDEAVKLGLAVLTIPAHDLHTGQQVNFDVKQSALRPEARLSASVAGVADGKTIPLAWVNMKVASDVLGPATAMMWPATSESRFDQDLLVSSDLRMDDNPEIATAVWLTIDCNNSAFTMRDHKSMSPADVSLVKSKLLSSRTTHEDWNLAKHLKRMDHFLTASGCHFPHCGVSWNNLSAVATVSSRSNVTTIANVVATAYRGLTASVRKPLLQNLTGYVAAGETLLVLGRPGSGCTTFLSALGGRLAKNIRLEGELLYNGEPNFEPFVGTTKFLSEDDTHVAALTVEETLTLAAELSMPPDAPFRDDLIQVQLQNVMARMGLAHVRNTVVGDAFLRGVSGGEKKRVSIAEAMMGRTSLMLCDDYTKGLDSLVALNILKAIRVTTRAFGVTFVAAQNQPSQEMYDLFDKVMVLHEGQCIYFGPTSEAKEYFTKLGYECPARRTTPDFLVAIGLDPPSRSRAAVPATNVLGKIFRESGTNAKTADLIKTGAAVSKSSKARNDIVTYSGMHTPVSMQTKLLLGRELSLLRNDPGFHIARVVRFAMIAALVGGIFFNLPTDEGGLFSRAGLIFSTTIFVSLSILASVPVLMQKREVYYKHKASRLYDGRAYFFSLLLVDFPITLLETFCFTLVFYYMAGLTNAENGLHFFHAWLVFVLLEYSMGNFARMLSCCIRDLVTVSAMAPGLLILCIFLAGFIIARENIPPYFVWIHYISPVKYAFEALMINEYSVLNFNTPAGPITGSSYLSERFYISFADNEAYSWGILAVMVGLGTVYVVTSILMLNKINFSADPRIIQFAKSRKSPLSDQNTSAGDLSRASTNVDMSAIDSVPPAILSWSHLSFQVSVRESKKAPLTPKVLLNDISGYVKPGSMLALMGASGAGKTTMLNLISQRLKNGIASGSVLLNGKPLDASFASTVGFVEQFHVLSPLATVREALYFAVEMKFPITATQSEKDAAVLRALTLLELKHLADAIIGAPHLASGISSEARKRVAIGTEIITKPPVVFLGLTPHDGSLIVMQVIRNLCSAGHAVVSTIHQPSGEVFEMFDSLLLLQKGGKTVYFGDLGQSSSTMLHYFKAHGANECKDDENPAEYMLEAISPTSSIDWPKTWAESSQSKELLRVMDSSEYLPSGLQPITRDLTLFPGNYKIFKQLVIRLFSSYWRDPGFNFTRVVFQLALALILGLTFLQLGHDQPGINYHVAALFFSSLMGAVTTVGSLPSILGTRELVIREKASGLYGTLAFMNSFLAVELPYLVTCTVLFSLVFYWLVGLSASGFGYFLLFNIIFQLYSFVLGQLIASAAANTVAAQQIAPPIFFMSNVFSGFVLRYKSIPDYVVWIYYLNPYHYFLEGVVANELAGETYTCKPTDIVCFPSGDAFLEYYSMFPSHKWWNMAVVIAFTVALRALTYLFLRYKNHQN